MNESPRSATSPLEILIVGAGAVGQVYGHHLVAGGARVTFYVRERYRAEAAAGFTIVRLRSGGRRAPQRFATFELVSSAAEVAGRRFDQVYLAIPSTGLAGAWLAELLGAIGEATLIGLTPSPGDRELLLAAGARPERLVAGLISLVSYHSPLPGEAPAEFEAPGGTTVWFPPGSPSLFTGPRPATDAVVATLRAGGLPARIAADVPAKGAFLSSVFMTYLLALEAAGWSFHELRRGQRLATATVAAREAMTITARTFGRAPLLLRLALRPSLLRIGLRLAPHLVPFPLETYVRVHFTKVGAQTRHIVAVAIERGRAAGLPVQAMEQLLGPP